MQSHMSPYESLEYRESMLRHQLKDTLLDAAHVAHTDEPEAVMAKIAKAHNIAEKIRGVRNELNEMRKTYG